MPKKRSGSKPTTPLGLLRGAVGSENNKLLSTAVEEYKLKGQVERFPFAYSQATANPNFANLYTPSRRVRELGQLGSARPLKHATLSRELQWAAVSCYFGRQILINFLALRKQFFLCFSNQDFVRAEAILDEIDAECGKSLWTIENRVCLLSAGPDGFEKQKKFVGTITKGYPRTNVSFMATSIGERNEPRVSAKAFEQRLRHRSTSWGINDDQLAHIFYRLCNTIEPSEQAYSSVLSYEGTYAIIDLYETLLSVARRARKMPFYDASATVAALEYLNEIVDDRKSALIRYLSLADETSGELVVPTYHLFFSKGSYGKVIEETSIILKGDPWNVDAIVAHAKACTACNSEPLGLVGLGGTLIPELMAYFSGSAQAEQAVDSILKSANNLRHSDLSVPLIILMKSRTYRWFSRLEEQCALTDIFVSSNVSFVERLPISDEMTDDYKFASKLYVNIINSDLECAQKDAKFLTQSTNKYYKALGKSFHANLLAKNLQIYAAIEESVDALLDHPGMIEFTPLVDLLKRRGYRDLKALSESPALSVAFHFYIENTEAADKDVALKVAWKSYLASKGCKKPSEYRPVDGFSKVERYFLSDVCTQSTMELGGAFSTQIELDRERIAICANLAAAFPSDADIYNQEIVDLTRRINIEEGVQLLESSRIYVDEVGIQRWAKKNLESQFLRYIDHLNVGLVDSISKLTKDLINILESRRGVEGLNSYLDDYDISADSLLEGIIRDLSQTFLQLPRFGLDAYLSSRVRHGSFVGYIRGPLESHRLVTKRHASSNKYNDNDYMLDKWGIEGERDRKVVNAKLAILSQSADKILDEMVERYLHVKSRAYSDGMITLATAHGTMNNAIKAWVVSTKTTIEQHHSLDVLVSSTIESFLWPAVRVSLDNLKNYIQINLRNELVALLDGFSLSIEGVTDKLQRERIASDVSAAKSELIDALRRVSLWFDLPKVNTSTFSMPLERVLEIGLRSTQSARSAFRPEVEWDIDPNANILVRGASIAILNDLAFNIFINISKHSGFEESDGAGPVKIWVSLKSEEDGSVLIVVANEISSQISIEEINKGLVEAKLKIDNKDFEAIDTQKKGTGLLRLALYFDPDIDDATSTDAADKNFKFWVTEPDHRFHISMRLEPTMVTMMKV
jgi:hypothetical protein